MLKLPANTRNITALYGSVIISNIIVWILALITYRHYPISLSLCLLAYGFGLRHGLDADHITAIDNVTRKLVQENIASPSIGFFFSLGHSSVVILLTVIIALTTHSMHHYFPTLSTFGNIFGGLFSAFFLLFFSLINFHIFCNVLRKIRAIRTHKNSNFHIHSAGLLSYFFNGLFKLVTKSWHMFPIGFLFGLGFDTATEIALLGMSAYQATHNLSIWVILLFPALFTAGMCLIDTTGGLCILGICRWATIDPLRKMLYNLTITGFSFITALMIGGYEILSVIANYWHFKQGFWSYVTSIDHHFTFLGGLIVTLMLLTWYISKHLTRMEPADD